MEHICFLKASGCCELNTEETKSTGICDEAKTLPAASVIITMARVMAYQKSSLSLFFDYLYKLTLLLIHYVLHYV